MFFLKPIPTLPIGMYEHNPMMMSLCEIVITTTNPILIKRLCRKVKNYLQLNDVVMILLRLKL